MLNDPRLLPTMRRQLERAKNRPAPRPELEGFTRDVSEIHKVHVTLTQLLQVMSRNPGIPLPVGPRYPSELIEAEDDAVDYADMEEDIKAANCRVQEGGGANGS
ncbi:MAG: hypothetical protein K2Y33_09330 [Mycolicibacterium frederiksbergense]|nr:hypothetical protein [Mycolicibacterium frederiksbergense]